jgi:peptide-methionine (S)-S-oxide reductase
MALLKQALDIWAEQLQIHPMNWCALEERVTLKQSKLYLIPAKFPIQEFWEMHDPTSLDRQGNDIGSQYRSAIFTTSEQQNSEVEQSMAIYQAELDKNSIGPIVTQVLAADAHQYFEAETYHQRYLEKNPNGYDCHSSTGINFPESMVSA